MGCAVDHVPTAVRPGVCAPVWLSACSRLCCSGWRWSPCRRERSRRGTPRPGIGAQPSRSGRERLCFRPRWCCPPRGLSPDVLVDAAGTSHIVWVTSDGVNADAVHYCRLPRAATACDSSQVLVPQKFYGDGDSPTANSSSGARIVQVGQQIVILDYRYPTDYPKPDGSSGSNTVLEWVSEDGGSTFTGPAVVGDQPIEGGVVEFGPANDPQILTTTDTVTGGTYVQSLPPGQYTSASANLGDGGPDQAYSGSLALDGGLPVAAFSDLHNTTFIRRWTGAGSLADASTWTPASALTTPGSEPKLAGGPGGLFLMDRTGNGPYTVQRVSGDHGRLLQFVSLMPTTRTSVTSRRPPADCWWPAGSPWRSFPRRDRAHLPGRNRLVDPANAGPRQRERADQGRRRR